MHPIRLRADNFTPPTRTPWGGTRILSAYKVGLDLAADKQDYPVVGESWEISVDPAFPSICVTPEGEQPLPALLAADAESMLGRDAERFSRSTPILLKLLDAADELSVQVHPPDDYAALSPTESGKPECWYVVDADPGAGLYLGLTEAASRQTLEDALTAGDDISPLLNFVPVTSGEMFVIEPGTVHAIGRGVTLVEPQIVLPGRSGKTYRFWDWKRRYDAQGQRDPHGSPRALHVSDSLAVTQFDGPRGQAFVDTTRRSPTVWVQEGDAALDQLATLRSMVVARLRGNGPITLPETGTLVAGFVVGGQVAFPGTSPVSSGESRSSSDASMAFQRGESFVLPASVGAARAIAYEAEVILVWMGPHTGI